ncbi:MAG: hypothetical protein GWP08_20380 [Nitrospiraceae bacterium]|nr:hypothetical protein [Nitrospiraceae bacterium]
MGAMMLGVMAVLCASPGIETFAAPGFSTDVPGVWFEPGEAASAMPLGGLGTGFVDLTSAATFGVCTTENTWLSPQPAAADSGFLVSVGGRRLDLFPGQPPPDDSLRFWGHYPAADVDFRDTFGEVSLYLRAFAPLIPHDYDLSGLPVALFRFTLENKGSEDVPVEIVLQWQAIGARPRPAKAETAQEGIQLTLPRGSYAVGAWAGEGWSLQNVRVREDLIRAQARRVLPAGHRTGVTFALAWFFPYWTSSDGERLRHRYAGKYLDAGDVMGAVLPRVDEIDRKIAAWQGVVYRAGVSPLLKDAVINSLYVWPRNSWWTSDGRFLQSESFTGCPITETFVCRFNGSAPLALLFPKCERATLRMVANAQRGSGEIPFAFGRPAASRSPYYQVQHPIVSSQFALNVYRDFDLWKDPAFLKEMYPYARKALEYMITLDKDGDGLVDEDPGSETGFPANQYYDVWPWWGTSAYTGSISLAALRAGEAMAKAMRDFEFEARLRGLRTRAGQSFEDKLWTGAYYRLYNDPLGKRVSDTSLTNALCGQWFAYTCGIGAILPEKRIQAVIDTVLRLNAAATPYGAVNGVRPDGSIDRSFADHSAALTIGEVWNFCAMAAFAGRTEDATRLFDVSYANVLLTQRTPWNIPWSLDPATGAIQWGINYYSNPCVWSVFQALAPESYASLTQPLQTDSSG